MSMKEFLTIPQITKNKIERARIYRLIREHRLEEGKDYKIITKEVKRIVIRNDFKLP